MLVTIETAANLVNVNYSTVYRYTFPYYREDSVPKLSKHEHNGYWMIDTDELKIIFPQYVAEINNYVATIEDDARLLVESKIASALSNRDWASVASLASALTLL